LIALGDERLDRSDVDGQEAAATSTMLVEPGARLGGAEAELGRSGSEIALQPLERAPTDVLGRGQLAGRGTVGQLQRRVARRERARGVEVVVERFLQLAEPALRLGRDCTFACGLADGELLAQSLQRQVGVLATALGLLEPGEAQGRGRGILAV